MLTGNECPVYIRRIRRHAMVKVGITEVDIAFEDKATAKERCQHVIEQAAANDVELLVLDRKSVV